MSVIVFFWWIKYFLICKQEQLCIVWKGPRRMELEAPRDFCPIIISLLYCLGDTTICIYYYLSIHLSCMSFMCLDIHFIWCWSINLLILMTIVTFINGSVNLQDHTLRHMIVMDVSKMVLYCPTSIGCASPCNGRDIKRP